MTADEATTIISKAIESREAEDFDADVANLKEQEWANPVLEAQNRWQGHDNGIVYGEYGKALAELLEHGESPTGCGYQEPDEEEGETAEANLIAALSSSGEIGKGAPLAYVGVDGYFTLIREGATVEEIEDAATDCLPDAYEEADDEEEA